MKSKHKHKTVEYEFSAPKDAEYFVGIDPSYSSTGLVILQNGNEEDKPVLATAIKAGVPKQHFYARLHILTNKLLEYLDELPRDKTYVCMEGAAFASEFNVFKLGKLSGVLEYWLGSHGFVYNLVAPTYLKLVATGKGAGTKQAVAQGVFKRWNYNHSCDDINDAYTLAQIARGALPPTQ